MNIESAKKAAEFVRLCAFDERGRIVHATVPGHDSELYSVEFDRVDGLGEANLLIVKSCCSDKGHCKGLRSSICYHAIAALMAAAKNYTLSFCKHKADAVNLMRFGGDKSCLVSEPSGKRFWIVYRKVN
jgi:hypothetical protein